MTRRALLALASAAVALSALIALRPPISVAAEVDPVRLTWEQAQIFIQYEDPDLNFSILDDSADRPYIREQLTLRAIAPGPVAIVMHSCAERQGLYDIRDLARALAEMGFLVVAPNSFARPDRVEGCDWRRQMRDPEISREMLQQMRLEELRYALARVREAPWALREQIFIAGFDEGADAVLGFTDPAIAGRIAVGAPCYSAVARDPALPTLVIETEADRWFAEGREPEALGRCRAKLSGAGEVEYVLLDGALHDPMIYEPARVALWNFLVRVNFL